MPAFDCPKPDRRQMLALLASLGFMPEIALAAPAPALRDVLDRAARAGSPPQAVALLRSVPPTALDGTSRIIAQMIARGIERETTLRQTLPFGKADGSSPYVVSQRHGAYLQLQGAKAPDGLRSQLDAETARLRVEADRGIVPPIFMIDAVLEAERRTLPSRPAAFAEALSRQIAVLEELRRIAPSEPGMWLVPNGETYYNRRLQVTSGTDETPMQIYARLSREIEALKRRADRLLRAQGHPRGTVGDRLRLLKARGDGIYPDSDAGRAQAVAGMNAALDRLRPRLPQIFSGPLELGASVRRMSAADEKAGKRGYRDPPTATGPGAYYPDLGTVRERPAWTLTTVAHHEALPGHLLQMRHQMLVDPHPLQIKYAAGYSEGWAIYAEMLADRLGLLSPLEQIGFIQSLLFRLARVTADIGIHHLKWSREQAIRHLEENVGFELFFPFAAEVDRYCAEPASFAGDAVVALTLAGLARPLQLAALKGFHQAMLDHGPIAANVMQAIWEARPRSRAQAADSGGKFG